MKKVICTLLVLIFCFSLISCDTGVSEIDKKLQGEWVRVEETQSSTKLYLRFSKGAALKTEQGANDKTEVIGQYTVTSDGYVVITYNDDTEQRLLALASDNGGIVLRDESTGKIYEKIN